MKLDVIAAVERCYANPDDGQAWLDDILEPLSPLDQGPGLYAQTFQWAPDGRWTLERSAVNGAFSLAALAEVARRNEAMPHETLRRIYARGYRGSVVQLRRHVATIRPARRTEAYLRLATLPGEQGQVEL